MAFIVRVRTLAPCIYELPVTAATTVKELKALVEDVGGPGRERARLIFRGSVLRDEQRMEQIGARGWALFVCATSPRNEGPCWL